MNIDEAVERLTKGEIVHSANSHETIVPKEVDGGIRVYCTQTLRSGEEETQIFWLSRMAMLYFKHDFGMGKFPEPPPSKKVQESKNEAEGTKPKAS